MGPIGSNNFGGGFTQKDCLLSFGVVTNHNRRIDKVFKGGSPPRGKNHIQLNVSVVFLLTRVVI